MLWARPCSTHIVFNVGLATCPEEYPARFVVSVLAAEMEGREAAAVPEVVVGLALAEELHRPAVSLPRGLV